MEGWESDASDGLNEGRATERVKDLEQGERGEGKVLVLRGKSTEPFWGLKKDCRFWFVCESICCFVYLFISVGTGLSHEK